MSASQTLIDKLWWMHEIVRREDGASLLWVDRHYVHEGSFHAFTQMKAREDVAPSLVERILCDNPRTFYGL